jgi:hypothetical protein
MHLVASNDAAATTQQAFPSVDACRPDLKTRVATTQICKPARRRAPPSARVLRARRCIESTIATQLGQITGEIADHKDLAGSAGTAAKLRVAASVFGFG